jgi:hypothetical protein
MENGLPPAAAEEQAASGSGDVPMMDATQTRRADELARKDRTLAEFMLMLDEYEPLVCLKVAFCCIWMLKMRLVALI